MRIDQVPVPPDSLFNTYREGRRPERWIGGGDCFSVSVDRMVTLREFVFAFYSSPAFRVERFLLGVFAGAPSSDDEVQSLADGSTTSFAVWNVGTRTATQLLLCDRYEKTRSWLQVVPADGHTELRFGSAVATRPHRDTGAQSISWGFRWLMGFHVLYSRILLGAAARQLRRHRS